MSAENESSPSIIRHGVVHQAARLPRLTALENRVSDLRAEKLRLAQQLAQETGAVKLSQIIDGLFDDSSRDSTQTKSHPDYNNECRNHFYQDIVTGYQLMGRSVFTVNDQSIGVRLETFYKDAIIQAFVARREQVNAAARSTGIISVDSNPGFTHTKFIVQSNYDGYISGFVIFGDITTVRPSRTLLLHHEKLDFNMEFAESPDETSRLKDQEAFFYRHELDEAIRQITRGN
ncbi:hypothetical protein H4R33_002495 [Dimargaris cristalligena]|nr:hypothetical protein H4R33_002495 [Dimargaris cristalligena]